MVPYQMGEVIIAGRYFCYDTCYTSLLTSFNPDKNVFSIKLFESDLIYVLQSVP
jgi:hypothetical protein